MRLGGTCSAAAAGWGRCTCVCHTTFQNLKFDAGGWTANLCDAVKIFGEIIFRPRSCRCSPPSPPVAAIYAAVCPPEIIASNLPSLHPWGAASLFSSCEFRLHLLRAAAFALPAHSTTSSSQLASTYSPTRTPPSPPLSLFPRTYSLTPPSSTSRVPMPYPSPTAPSPTTPPSQTCPPSASHSTHTSPPSPSSSSMRSCTLIRSGPQSHASSTTHLQRTDSLIFCRRCCRRSQRCTFTRSRAPT